MNAKQQDQENACAVLRTILKPGDTVYTILRHVSRSGMSRDIGVVVGNPGVEPIQDITGLVARACRYPLNKHGDGVKVGGCGMDMGFAVVYDLSWQLYGRGWTCLGKPNRQGKGCPSPDHVNPGPDRDKYGPTVTHTEGYALRQRWL